MTEQIKNAIGELERTRDTRVFFPKDISMKLAIRSLQAWGEVLQELEEHRRNGNNIIGLNEAIGIINQHLAEIEEGEEDEDYSR